VRQDKKREPQLIKVHVDLPHHWAVSGESMWAAHLGGDRYEIRNVPFYAYGLNFGDVVTATADDPSLKPEVRRVLKRSSHQTMRVCFMETVPLKRRISLLRYLARFAVVFEGGTETLFALDLKPDADVDRVRDRLDEWCRRDLCDYETGEARVGGSFGGQPEEDSKKKGKRSARRGRGKASRGK
jgi:hypothetical protein